MPPIFTDSEFQISTTAAGISSRTGGTKISHTPTGPSGRPPTGYGSAFGNAIMKNYPGPDYDDLMAIVDAAVAKGYVDTTRMYVGGCSGGGVLSSWVIQPWVAGSGDVFWNENAVPS